MFACDVDVYHQAGAANLMNINIGRLSIRWLSASDQPENCNLK
ncbi:MAG: hypothetical protein WBC19_07210 [Pyrinomonadaceae bacterium]